MEARRLFFMSWERTAVRRGRCEFAEKDAQAGVEPCLEGHEDLDGRPSRSSTTSSHIIVSLLSCPGASIETTSTP